MFVLSAGGASALGDIGWRAAPGHETRYMQQFKQGGLVRIMTLLKHSMPGRGNKRRCDKQTGQRHEWCFRDGIRARSTHPLPMHITDKAAMTTIAAK